MTFDLHLLGLNSQQLVQQPPLERRRSVLANADLVRSSGPWICLANTEPVFDAIDAGSGIGYNASPLFGVLHHPAAWSEPTESPDFDELDRSIQAYSLRNPGLQQKLSTCSLPRAKIRAYIASNIIDQFEDQMAILESNGQDIVSKKSEQIPGFQAAVKIQGRRLTIDFRDRLSDPCLALLSQRILADVNSAGEVEMHLPLSLSSVDFEFLIDRVAFVWEPNQKPSLAFLSFDDDWGLLRDHRAQYQFHAHLLDYKRLLSEGTGLAPELELGFVRSLLPQALAQSELVLVTPENWSLYRERVAEMQGLVYEPARQTAITKFDALMDDEFGFGLLVLDNDEIAGMAFIGPLDLFPEERGTLDDPHRGNRHTMYTLDLTIAPQFRGSLGKVMKQAITLMTAAEGHHAIHGRNRDHLARGMWAINLGLGSYELKRLANDYADNQRHCDCIYYRCPLRWPKSVPLSPNLVDGSDGFAHLARIVND